MDSPESSTKPALAQDSPVFSYISNLSPIQTVRALAVSQGFSGLNSPPLVFTSPQLTPHNQSALLRRERFLGRSTIELFRHEAGCKNRATANNGSEKLDSPLSTRLINHACEGSNSKSLVKDQIESPIDCSDQFLTDVVNMDSVDPNVSCDRTVKVLEYVDQLLETTEGSKEFAVNTDNNLESRIKEEIAVDPPTIITDIEDVNAKDIPVDVTVVSRDVKLGDGISTDQLQEIEPELPISNSLTIQDTKDSTSENVEIGESGRVDQPTALLSGAILIDEEKENTVDDAGAVLTETVPMEEQRSYEVLQFRGTRRRCLQFENAQHKEMPYCPAQNPSDSEVPKRQFLETPRTSVEGKQADKIQPVSHRINNLKLTTTIPKPSGMLHLNSIAKVVQTESGGTCNLKSAQMGNIRICGKKFIPVSNCHLSDNIKNSSVISATENVSASIDDKMHESHSSEAANSAASLSAKPSNDFVILNQVEATPEYKRRCNTENDSGSNGLSISKKKRKVSSDSTDGDGCRRCNCKKSRCLKLYCDCFAAGIYCVDPCTCQGCLNRPEYEDTVLDTRQQIESRNPLAFAPKVVQPIIERPLKSSGEDQTHFTPASARHKRGCNCKKSMCLKKYCECYQGNVGCSDGCRCEGCQNIFGKKGEYRITENVLGEKYSSGRKDVSSVENFEIPASENGVYSMGLPNAHSLTPVTPEFDFSNHRKDASKDWFPSGRCLQSPESGPQFIAPYAMFPEPPTNSDGNDKTSENVNENLDLISFDHEIDHGDAETVGNFAALRQQPWNVGPLCSMSNLQEWASIPDAHCLSGSRQYSTLSSFQWRGSPNTPVVQFSGTKHLQVAGFDSELSNIMQDDTPELLKDSPTPPNAVKVNSPNKKRVSPPFGRPKFGPISAASVPTVRKFILRGVPSFPPLTPCTDSKTAVQQTNDHQNFRDNKLPES